MIIGIPTANGELSAHFGHCDQFALVEADAETKEVLGVKFLSPPGHEPGALPKALADEGVELVIAGGMGRRAQQFFSQYGIQVMTGAPEGTPDAIAKAYLQGTLECGGNVCDH